MRVKSNIHIRAPKDAVVYLQGERLNLENGYLAETVQLPQGQNYQYVIHLELTQGGTYHSTSQRIQFKAGEAVRLDYTDVTAWAKPIPPSGLASARISVTAPLDAVVTVQGMQAPMDKGRLSFELPNLTPNRTYYYTFKAKSKNSDLVTTRNVAFKAGDQVNVDFQTPTTQTTAGR